MCGRAGIQPVGSLISKFTFLTTMLCFLFRVSRSVIYGELVLKSSRVLVKNIVSETHREQVS